MFVHSGLLDVKPVATPEASREEGRKFVAGITAQFKKRDFSDLGEGMTSILNAHDWIETYHRQARTIYAALGISRLVVGHEPGALSSKGEIAISPDQWLIKLDAGMNAEAEDSEGRLLRCVGEKCEQLGPKGGASPLAAGIW
jgi:hypothetical protein